MKKLILSVFIFTFGFATATHAQQVNTLLTKQLPEAPGKEIEVITVNYAPGAVDAIHRHDAHAVVYVLEGEVEMQVRGGTLRRLGPGQVFYESPEDVHTVSRNASKTKPAKFVVFFIKNEGAPNVEARMNSKAAQLRENGTEIVRLFARFALGASFLSAVADRFGLWGPYGAKNVSWGNFAHFVEYTGAVTSLFPSSSTVSFAWAATIAETLFGILLIAGFKIRMASVLSGLLLLSFAIGMVTGLGIKTPFDYSVFSAAAAAFLLAFWEPDRFTLDKLLNRLRN
jgi:quercetin dioxygenase-like cupin family protein/uncharacterized membrane protein YphA (DoxX/SURF4 family)